MCDVVVDSDISVIHGFETQNCFQLGIILKIGDNLHIGRQSPFLACIQTKAQITQIPTQTNVSRFEEIG